MAPFLLLPAFPSLLLKALGAASRTFCESGATLAASHNCTPAGLLTLMVFVERVVFIPVAQLAVSQALSHLVHKVKIPLLVRREALSV